MMSDDTGRDAVVMETRYVWRCGGCYVEARSGGGFWIGHPSMVIQADELRPIALALLAAADAVDPQDGGAE